MHLVRRGDELSARHDDEQVPEHHEAQREGDAESDGLSAPGEHALHAAARYFLTGASAGMNRVVIHLSKSGSSRICRFSCISCA